MPEGAEKWNGEYLCQGHRNGQRILEESQPTLYKAVRSKLKNWKLSDTQINAIEESGTVRENFRIYATVSGTVSEVMAAQGDYVNQGQPIVKFSNLNSVWA